MFGEDYAWVGLGVVSGAKASASTADASVPADSTLEFRATLRARGISVTEHQYFE